MRIGSDVRKRKAYGFRNGRVAENIGIVIFRIGIIVGETK
jgi:hypothetical protein